MHQFCNYIKMKNQQQVQHPRKRQLSNITADLESWEQSQAKKAAYASVGSVEDRGRLGRANGPTLLEGASGESSANDYYDTHEHEGQSQRAGKRRMRMPLSSGCEDAAESTLGVLSSRVLLFDRHTNFTFHDSSLLTGSRISHKIGARKQEQFAHQARNKHMKNHNIKTSNILQMKKQRVQDSIQTMISKGQAKPTYDAPGALVMSNSLASQAENFVSKLTDKRMATNAASNLDTARASQLSQGDKACMINPLSSLHGHDSSISYLEPNHGATQKRSRISLLMNTGNEPGIIKMNAGMQLPSATHGRNSGLQSKGSPKATRLNQSQIIREGYRDSNDQRSMNPFIKFQTPMSKAYRQLSEQQFQGKGFRNSKLDPSKFDFDFSSQNTGQQDINQLSQNLRNGGDYGTTQKYSGTLAPQFESVKQYVQFKDQIQDEELGEAGQWLTSTMRERALINKIIATKAMKSGQLNHFHMQAQFKKARIKQSNERPQRVQVDPTQSAISQRFEKQQGKNYLTNAVGALAPLSLRQGPGHKEQHAFESELEQIRQSQIVQELQKHYRYLSRDEMNSHAGKHSVLIERSEQLMDKASSSSKEVLGDQIQSQSKTPKTGKLLLDAQPSSGKTPKQSSKRAGLAPVKASQGRHRTQMDKYQSQISNLHPARINRAAAHEANVNNVVERAYSHSAKTSEYTDYDDDDVKQAPQQLYSKQPTPKEPGATRQSPADQSIRYASSPKQKPESIQSASSQPWSPEQQNVPADLKKSQLHNQKHTPKKVNFSKHAAASRSGLQSQQDFASATLPTPAAGTRSKDIGDPHARAQAAPDMANEQAVGRPKDGLSKITTKLGETDLQIQNTLANALASSRDDGGIDPAIVAELRQLNRRFMDQAQLDQLWVIEQKNSWIQGAKQLEQKIQQECQERLCSMGAVPTLDKLSATNKAIGDERVRNYQANLAALELSVFEEFNNQNEESPPTHASGYEVNISHHGKLTSKKTSTRRKAAGGSRLSKSSRKTEKEQALEPQSQETPSVRKQHFQEQIAVKMALRHVEDLKGLQRKGIKMIGEKGNIDFEQLREGQIEHLYKVIKYVHKRQQDLLIHHQPGDKRSYEDNFLMELEAEKKEEKPENSETKSENDSDDESEGSAVEEERKKEESESPEKTTRLPMIKKKYPNLSIGTSEYFNNKIEVDFNNKYAAILKENEAKYLLKQKEEIDLFLQRFKEGQISKNDEQYKRYMRLLASKIEKIRRTKNTALSRMQEHLLEQVLTEQYEQQANVHAKGDPQLTNLAMLKSKKPKPEVKKMLAVEENAELHDYIGDLRGMRLAKAPPQSVFTRQALYMQDEASKEKARLNSQASIKSPAVADQNLYEVHGDSSSPLNSSPLPRSGQQSKFESAHMSLNGMSRETTSKEVLQAPSAATLESKNQKLQHKHTQRGRMIEASIKQYTKPHGHNVNNSALLRHAGSRISSLGLSRSGTADQLPAYGDADSRVMKDVSVNQVFQNAEADRHQKRLIDQVSRDLMHKVRSIDAKRSLVTSEKARMEAQNNPAMTYFNQILQSDEIDLPIFQMVHDDELVIENYLLRPGHCEAILKGLRCCQAQAKQFFNQVIFNGNQLKDKDFSKIIEGLSCLTNLKKLQYQNNDFGGLSLQQLAPILQRSQPYHLKALVLSNCNQNSTVLTDLLELLHQKSSLQFLALQRAVFDEGAVTSLVRFLEKNQKLKKLDLSWCELRATGFKPILECLSRNRRLEDINLSWNDISDMRSTPSKEEQDRTAPAKVQSKEEKEQAQIGRQLEAAQYIVTMLKYNKKLRHLDLSNTGLTTRMFEIIAQNFKRAMSLLSLHLSGNPFLLEIKDDFKEVIKTIRAKPLLPDNYPVFREQKEILRPQEHKEMFMMNRIAEKQKSGNLSIQVIDPFIQRKCIIQRKIGHKLDIPLSGQWQILRDANGSEPQKNGNADVIQNQSQKATPKENSMLKKKDGRNSNLGPQAAGLEKEECWCCHNYQYTLIFWSQSIQFEHQRAAKKLQNDYVDIFAKHLKAANLLPAPDRRGLTYVSEKSDEEADHQDTHSVNRDGAGKNEDTQPDRRDSKLSAGAVQIADRSHSARSGQVEQPGNAAAGGASGQGAVEDLEAEPEEGEVDVASEACNSTRSSIQPPMIYMATNNWQPAKMLDAIEFAATLDPEKPAEEDVLQILKDKGKIPLDIQHVDQLTKIQKGWVTNEKIHLENNYRKKWADILISNLQYRNPCLINAEHALAAAARKEPVYIYPVFLKPGKHSFLVAQQDEFDEATIEKTIQTCVIGVREEPLPAIIKTNAKKANIRRFEKQSSVFAKWLEDDDNLYYSILNNHDYVKWKMTRFVKDDTERAFVTTYIRQHIAQLKEVYTQLQSESTNYPGISQLSFSDFCQDSGLLGKHFNISTADRLFISANYNDASDAGANSAKELLRYEFLEVLVRIAKVKYLDSGIYDSYKPALEHLITEEISTYPSKQTWQRWRSEELWTIACNDVLKANLDGLNKLYKSYVAPRNKTRKIKIADACDLFANDSKLKITDKQCKYCFGMSKMTVVNEEWEADKYNTMAFVEFLEMVGRVAVATFSDTDIAQEPLTKRIEYVLDAILPLVDVERQDPMIEEVDETESDQEY